jgi:hypothetical protein
MILYNVTLNVDDDIHFEWLKWMKEVHLPEVMATGKFVSFGMYRIQNHEPGDQGNNYSVQYHADTMADYEDYVKNYGPALKAKTIERYGEKVLAFRTILEKVL